MKKIQSIIIFTLLLLLGLVIKELYDYKNITNKLLVEYNQQKKLIKILKIDNQNFEEQIKTQKETFDLTLSQKKRECQKEDLSLKYLNDVNSTISHKLTNEIKFIDIKKEQLTIENENKITGYGLNYLQAVPQDNNEENYE